MTEYVGCTPQQFDSCFCLFLFSVSNDFFQIGFVFFNRIGFCHQVYIVEAVIFDTHFLHEFETGIHFVFCSLHGVVVAIPRELFSTASKLVAAFCTESVPPCHSELQPVFHLFTIDHLLSIVVTECHRVLALFTFKFNLSYSGKILFCCHNLNN